MKLTFVTLCFVFIGLCSAFAQQISVVTPAGTTTSFTDLNTAITSAETGSTVYLSGGGFQIDDATKITKRLSIIGIGHRTDTGNADGSTAVSGNLFFEEGSDNSILMGVYLSGNVYVATSATAVNNFLIRYCNINSLQVRNQNSQNILVNQNYIRNESNGGNASLVITNNVFHSFTSLTGASIDHNIIRHHSFHYCKGYSDWAIEHTDNSQITNNILLDPASIHCGSNCLISNNLLSSVWGENSIQASDFTTIFQDTVKTTFPIESSTNFHIVAGHPALTAATDGGEVGIYGGTGFSDRALPPGPRIVSKKIAEQTDSEGNLHVEIQVSAE